MVTTDIWLISYLLGLFTGVGIAVIVILTYDAKESEDEK